MRESRAAVIAAHVAVAQRSGLTLDAFADTVAGLYRHRTPLHAQCIKFHLHACGSNPYDVMRANAQIVARHLDGTVRMAVDIEESLVLALPEPMRGECLRELADRLGLLAAEKPGQTTGAATAQVGALAGCFGDAMRAIAPMLDDGTFDAGDAPLAPHAIDALNGLIAAATTLARVDRALLGGKPAAMPLERH